MDQEQIEKVKLSIQKLEEKTSRIYFFVHDTKGNAKASIKYIYDMALTLKNNGKLVKRGIYESNSTPSYRG